MKYVFAVALFVGLLVTGFVLYTTPGKVVTSQPAQSSGPELTPEDAPNYSGFIKMSPEIKSINAYFKLKDEKNPSLGKYEWKTDVIYNDGSEAFLYSLPDGVVEKVEVFDSNGIQILYFNVAKLPKSLTLGAGDQFGFFEQTAGPIGVTIATGESPNSKIKPLFSWQTASTAMAGKMPLGHKEIGRYRFTRMGKGQILVWPCPDRCAAPPHVIEVESVQ